MPHYCKDIDLIESVQKRATNIISSLGNQRWGLESLDLDLSPGILGLGLESHTFRLGLDLRHAGLT